MSEVHTAAAAAAIREPMLQHAQQSPRAIQAVKFASTVLYCTRWESWLMVSSHEVIKNLFLVCRRLVDNRERSSCCRSDFMQLRVFGRGVVGRGDAAPAGGELTAEPNNRPRNARAGVLYWTRQGPFNETELSDRLLSQSLQSALGKPTRGTLRAVFEQSLTSQCPKSGTRKASFRSVLLVLHHERANACRGFSTV